MKPQFPEIVSERAFTTGRVAKLCGVAPRTVTKWIDKGILKGRRIPGSLDRRVDLRDLKSFLKENGMFAQLRSIGGMVPRPRVVLVGFEPGKGREVADGLNSLGIEAVLAASSFEAGLRCAGEAPHAVAVDSSVGRIDGSIIATTMADREAAVLWVASDNEGMPDGFLSWCPRDMDRVASWFADHVAIRESVPAA